MSKTSCIPHNDAGKGKLLERVAKTLPKYQILFEISNEDMGTLQGDALSFPFANDLQNLAQSFAHNLACRVVKAALDLALHQFFKMGGQ